VAKEKKSQEKMWWCNHHVVAWVIYLIQCLMLWSLRLCVFFFHTL